MLTAFQFHIGAIRRKIYSTALRADLCFNSILVQLEAGIFPRRPKRYRRFNSILVQLEVLNTGSSVSGIITFQFHIGAIRRSYMIEQ